MKAYQTLKCATPQRGVFEITIARGEVKNAFNDQMIEELTQVFTTDALDDAHRVIVLRGDGGMFCAGGDLAWMKRSSELSLEENHKETRKLTNLFRIMNEFKKPVIGEVTGAAIGGGVGLVSICDYVIATRETVFSLSEVRLGIVPACIGPFVVAKIGASQARALFVSAKRFKAQKALEIGLIHEIVENEEELKKTVASTVVNMLECGPRAMEAAKNLVLNLSWPEKRAEIKNPFDYVSSMLAELRVTPEGQEGLKAFLEKRKPNWTGLK